MRGKMRHDPASLQVMLHAIVRNMRGRLLMCLLSTNARISPIQMKCPGFTDKKVYTFIQLILAA